MRNRDLGRLILAAGTGLALLVVCGCSHRPTKPEIEKMIAESEVFNRPVMVAVDVGDLTPDDPKNKTACPQYYDGYVSKWAEYEKFIQVQPHSSNASKVTVALMDFGKQSAQVTPFKPYESDEKCDVQVASWKIATHIDPYIMSVQYKVEEDREYNKYDVAEVKFTYMISLTPLGEDLYSDTSEFYKKMSRERVSVSDIDGLPSGPLTRQPGTKTYIGDEGFARLIKVGSDWSVAGIQFKEDEIESRPRH